MGTEKQSEASLKVESDTKQLLRINKLAKTSMLIGICAPIGGIYMFFTANYDLMTVIFLFSLFLSRDLDKSHQGIIQKILLIVSLT